MKESRPGWKARRLLWRSTTAEAYPRRLPSFDKTRAPPTRPNARGKKPPTTLRDSSRAPTRVPNVPNVPNDEPPRTAIESTRIRPGSAIPVVPAIPVFAFPNVSRGRRRSRTPPAEVASVGGKDPKPNSNLHRSIFRVGIRVVARRARTRARRHRRRVARRRRHRLDHSSSTSTSTLVSPDSRRRSGMGSDAPRRGILIVAPLPLPRVGPTRAWRRAGLWRVAL